MAWIQSFLSVDYYHFSEASPFIVFVSLFLQLQKDKKIPQTCFSWNFKIFSVIDIICTLLLFTIFIIT